MLNWKTDYYTGDGIKNPEKIRKNIDKRKAVIGIYLITLSENPGNLLEIFPAALLVQKAFYAICPEILGMAKGKEAAMEMAADLIKEVYEATGAFQVKEYFDQSAGPVESDQRQKPLCP